VDFRFEIEKATCMTTLRKQLYCPISFLKPFPTSSTSFKGVSTAPVRLPTMPVSTICCALWSPGAPIGITVLEGDEATELVAIGVLGWEVSISA
jgi:hypothetical protein